MDSVENLERQKKDIRNILGYFSKENKQRIKDSVVFAVTLNKKKTKCDTAQGNEFLAKLGERRNECFVLHYEENTPEYTVINGLVYYATTCDAEEIVSALNDICKDYKDPKGREFSFRKAAFNPWSNRNTRVCKVMFTGTPILPGKEAAYTLFSCFGDITDFHYYQGAYYVYFSKLKPLLLTEWHKANHGRSHGKSKAFRVFNDDPLLARFLSNELCDTCHTPGHSGSICADGLLPLLSKLELSPPPPKDKVGNKGSKTRRDQKSKPVLAKNAAKPVEKSNQAKMDPEVKEGLHPTPLKKKERRRKLSPNKSGTETSPTNLHEVKRHKIVPSKEEEINLPDNDFQYLSDFFSEEYF